MESKQEVAFDIFGSIQKHISMITPWFPKKGFICIGDYPARIFLKGNVLEKAMESQSLFINKSSKNLAKWSQNSLDEKTVLGLDKDVDTHFWFDALPHITENGFMRELENTSINKVHEAVITSALWDGFDSAVLPVIIDQSELWNMNCLAAVILPSKIQPSDAKFNTIMSLGKCLSGKFIPVLLFDRDLLEGYVGVDRKGSIINGNAILDYIMEMILAKDEFIQEIIDLLKPFNSKVCGVLTVVGASFKIYGNLDNILSTTLIKPLSEFDLSGVSLVNVLIRMPLKLKEKLSKGIIELAVAGWFEDKATVRSLNVSEPVYVDDALDRIDVILIVSGHDNSKLFSKMEKDASPIKNHAIEKEFIKKEDWQALTKSLTNS